MNTITIVKQIQVEDINKLGNIYLCTEDKEYYILCVVNLQYAFVNLNNGIFWAKDSTIIMLVTRHPLMVKQPTGQIIQLTCQ